MTPINKNWTDGGFHQGGVSTGIGFTISWQRGPLNTEGRNGAFLLEVLDSCLTQLIYYEEENPLFSCEENQVAIEHLKLAISSLEKRRNHRKEEGKLGTINP